MSHTATLQTRRQLLADVRAHIKCEFYNGYIVGLQWNPGKSAFDKEYGNVTAYITEPDGNYVLLPIRVRLTANYQQEVSSIAENIKSYIDKVETTEKARRAAEATLEVANNAMREWQNHKWIE